jgi:anhydro-N-acetylmuramic acid kinase
MTGTSIDALDVAMVAITGSGLDMRGSLVALHSEPLGELARTLRRIASEEQLSAREIAGASWALGELHAFAISRVVTNRAPDLICAHGQTVMHAPSAPRGRTWQLLQPAPIAARWRCPVVFDLRAMDVAMAGQGAPLTPIADWILFRAVDRTRVILNLGGFANMTLLPAGASHDFVRGFDVCACNQLLDAVARDRLHAPFDKDGAAAAAGTVNGELFDALTRQLELQSRSGRSLGDGDDMAQSLRWATHLPPQDVARTACEAIAGVIGRAVAKLPEAHRAREAFLAGGGAFHPVLSAAIERAAGIRCMRLDALGVPVQAREAMCFAVLGALCQDRVAITLPQVTGVSFPAPRAGAWCFPP